MSDLTGHQIRDKFLQFFKGKDHVIVSSSSLVPTDPSVLLTTAGMQQFKPYFLGKESPHGNRVASVQKSFRTSDIEQVGDETHLTFFEMLGNFSFNYPKGQGSYFKEEAIKLGFEFVRDTLGVDQKRISVSVFGGDGEVPLDTESIAIWKTLGFTDTEIKKGTREDNFWGPTGDEGPCGPTSEIYVDGVEVWNLVFNEYFSDQDKKLTKLASQGVDTGMGLERMTQVMQGKKMIGDSDLFSPINGIIRKSLSSIDDRSMRIISDHLRGSVFLIADGVTASNKEQGYILRRLLRQSLILARDKGSANWFEAVVGEVVSGYKAAYPELEKNHDKILATISEEARKFGKTLERGFREFEQMREEGDISGEDAYYLHETFGFPFEVTEELVRQEGGSINREEYEQAAMSHKDISRAGAKGKFGGHGLITASGEIVGGNEEERKRILRMHTSTHLLHQALRDIFGDTVQQMGSDINAERLRFDFSHPSKLSPEDISKVENIVNRKITEGLPVYRKEMTKNEAEKTGALAFFKDKYGGTVSVYFIGSEDPLKAYSKEFCGGPHVTNTKEIGHFKILKEEAVGAGVRRIKATVK